MCMRSKKCLSISIVIIAVIVSAASFMFAASASGGDVSPAIAVLRSETVLYKCGICRETVNFSKSDFEKALGSDFKYITLTSLPAETAGMLKLSGIPVASGQTIAASSLNYLTFTPAGNGEGAVSFTFRCDADGWLNNDVTCTVKLTTNRNTSPVLTSGAFSTVRNVKTEYRLNLFEPDGDKVKLMIDAYPISGSICVDGDVVVYTPVRGFTGSDSMIVRAVDEYGNASAAANITIKVGKSEIVFSDMSASSAHAAAIALAENSIVTYVYKDGEYLFNPELPVSRIDFLVMLMSSADVKVDDSYAALPFDDTDKLSEGRKKYLAKAVAMGIVASEPKEFRPGESVIRSEAAVWATKLLGLKGQSSAYPDTAELDVETAVCVAAVADAGIITAKNGLFVPNGTINREEAARILIRVVNN